MTHDPKINPWRGDIVEKDKTSRHVFSSFAGRVTFSVKIGQQWLNSFSRETINEWRENVKDWEVVHEAK